MRFFLLNIINWLIELYWTQNASDEINESKTLLPWHCPLANQLFHLMTFDAIRMKMGNQQPTQYANFAFDPNLLNENAYFNSIVVLAFC